MTLIRFRNPTRQRHGVVAALVAISLIVILSVVALALDGGTLFRDRRKAQTVADAAALAAAADLFENYPANNGLDPGGTARAAALAVAASNGYPNDGTRTVVTVNIPPSSGAFAGRFGHVEVIVRYNRPRGFSNLLGSGDIPVIARAVARGRWINAPAIMTLDLISPYSLLIANGTGDITVLQGSVVVSSNHAQGAGIWTSANLRASEFAFSGGYELRESGNFIGTVQQNARQFPDPLKYIPSPDASSLPTQTLPLPEGQVYNLLPGRYVGGLSFVGSYSVNMAPGIYFMDGGGFRFASSGSLQAQGVMIYSQQVVSITGSGSVSMSPLTSGIHQGVTVFQDRGSSASVTISHSAGNGSYNITGAVYAANSLVTINRQPGDLSLGSQYISRKLTLAGTGNITVSGVGARTRQYGLVR